MARRLLIPEIGTADLRLLRVFKTVAECGGLSAAETELNVGLPTISKKISDLESRLGMRLCTRGAAGFFLTDEGMRVLSAADALLDSVRDFRAQVSELRETLAGTLRLAVFDQCHTNPEARLGRAIREFIDRAPEVELNLSMLPPNEIEARLHEGQLDVGIIAMHRQAPGLSYLPVHGEDMFLYCGKSHPFFDRAETDLTMEEVRKARYAGVAFNSPNLQYGRELDMQAKAVVQNEAMLAVLVLSGQFVGFLPDHMARPYEQKGQMSPVLPGSVKYRTAFAAATRKVPEPNRLTREFVSVLEQFPS